MNRKDTIDTLLKMAEEYAKEFNFTLKEESDDREKGVWGEGLSICLESIFGECTKRVRLSHKDNKSDYVEFRFRFSNPVLAISFNTLEEPVYASVELTDHRYVNKELVKFDKVKLSEMQVFGLEGWHLAERLRNDVISRILSK